MALDPAVSDQLTTIAITNAQESAKLIGMAATNLTQGLGVVNTTLIQQHGGVSDDSGLIAALQTASGAPRQGSLVAAGQGGGGT